jgi:hypothetical protein
MGALTSTSIVSFVIALGFVVPVASAQLGADAPESGFSVPQYDSNRELGTEFVPTFSLMFFILYVGFERSLRLVMDLDQHTKTLRNRAALLALVTTGTAVPTTLFQLFNDFVAGVFGLASALFFVAILYGLVKFLLT